MGAHADDGRLMTALVEELMKKSALCWLRVPGVEREAPVWHLWHDGAAYVLSGGSEQPAPGLDSAATVTVVVRTKDSRQRLVAWQAEVSRLHPDDPDWTDVVRAMVGARLNLRDLERAPQRWAEESVVHRLTPTGTVEESPGRLPDADLSAPPAPTPATTRRGLPRVLHRRQTRRPDLR